MSSQMNENMLCAICQDTMTDPVTAACGAHNFCKECLSTHIVASSQRYQTPTCPTCRSPIQTTPSQLHVNVALRDIILGPVPVQAQAQAQVAPTHPITITATKLPGTNKLHIKLSVPESASMPTVIQSVLDRSGSMGMSSMDTSQRTSEAAALSREDLVCHAFATQIKLTGPDNELGLILFDNVAETMFPPTKMTPAGQRMAESFLPCIAPRGGTSIWAGLQKALTVAALPEHAGKNIVIILQTDGESDPSLNPPRGIPAAFRAWRDSHPSVHLTLHTIGYGFGQALDMPLLRTLAEIGEGTVNYIPDGSMVGTVFVHLLANLMSSVYRGVRVHIPDEGLCIPVGFLQTGQSRDIIVALNGPSASSISVSAENTDVITTLTTPIVEAESQFESFRVDLVDALTNALNLAEAGNMASANSVLDSIVASAPVDAGAEVKALLVDLRHTDPYKGQIGKAFASTVAFQRWGRHYLPTYICGLRNQWAINFKDEASKLFGAPSGLTRRLIDRGDEIFNALPPPKASCGPAGVPINMASVNSVSGPCFLGASRMKMKNNTEKRCDEIRAGDVDIAGYEIMCVVKTLVKEAHIVRLEGWLRPDNHAPLADSGGFTAWHPVHVNGAWQFPAHLGEIECVKTDAIYNFVLRNNSISENEDPGLVIINGVLTCTLGHNFEGPVIGHPYFGRDILDDLKNCEGFKDGLVIWDTECMEFIRDPETGLVCGRRDKRDT